MYCYYIFSSPYYQTPIAAAFTDAYSDIGWTTPSWTAPSQTSSHDYRSPATHYACHGHPMYDVRVHRANYQRPTPVHAAVPVTSQNISDSFLSDDVNNLSGNTSGCDDIDLLLEISAISPGPLPDLSGYFSDDSSPQKVPSRKRKTHTCGLCMLPFKSRSEYSMHVKTHHKQTSYECDVCRKKFNQVSTMRTHRRKHTGERPYACPWCPRTFSDHSAFIKHKRIHSNDRPYTCVYCPKTFIQSGNCNRHMKSVHGHKVTKWYVCYWTTLSRTPCVPCLLCFM